MPIRNYTTDVSADKSAAQIQQRLARMRARSILTEYDDAGEMAALSFALPIGETVMHYRLPANAAGVLRAMQRDKKVARHLCNADQARRVAWRILQDWIDSQLAVVEAGLVSMDEVMLPYMLTKSGATLHQAISAGGYLQLTGPITGMKGDGR